MTNNPSAEKPQLLWKCAETAKYGKEKTNVKGEKVGCNCKAIHEQVLQNNFLAVLNLVIENKEQVICDLKEYVQRAINNSPDKSKEIKEIGASLEKMAMRKSKLIDLLVDGLISRTEYEKTYKQYDKQTAVLQKQWEALKLDNKTAETLQQKLVNIERVIENIVKLKEFNESVCGEILSKVVVESRDKMSFYLTSGDTADPVFFKIPLSLPQYLSL
jgi:hypothetical protein